MVKNTQLKTESTAYPYHLDIMGKSHIPDLQIDAKYIEYRRCWEENPKNKIISNFPLHLDIEATGRCNLMCRHCYRYSRRTKIGDVEMELFKKIINEGAKYNLPSLGLNWMGEPFLHPQLVEMIRYAKNKGILDVRISTNGVLTDEEIVEEILDSGLDMINFSVDAVTKETYNKVKFGSDFELVNRNINHLIALKEKRGLRKPTIIVQMIDDKQTHKELMAFIYYWKNKADRIRIATYQSPDGRPHDKMRIQNTPETIFPCPQLWQRLTIAWDGTVYPCLGDNACRTPLGNAKENSTYDIWHSDSLNYLREKHKKYEADDLDMCLHCDLNKVPKIINDYGKDRRNEN